MVPFYISVVTVILISIVSAEESDRPPLLLLISFDGFRFDLLNESNTPNLWQFAKEGVHFVNGVKSEYVTFTTPNHVSITTGLYQEDHGIVGNTFYEAETMEYYDYYNISHEITPEEQPKFLERRWYETGGVPIWLQNEVVNEKNRTQRRSASLYWPLADADWPTWPHKPQLYRPWYDYENLTMLESAVDEIVDLFSRRNDPYNFVAWYVSEPDHALHVNGFETHHIGEKLKELDDIFGTLLGKLTDIGLMKKLNIIFTSDHGHAQIGENKTLCVPEHISYKGIELGDFTFYPKTEADGKRFFADFTQLIKRENFGAKLVWKKDFPKRYHYGASGRVGEIILGLEPGYGISFGCNRTKYDKSSHGYDPDDWRMRAVLILNGPAFTGQLELTEIPQNIDLYPLMCRILDLPTPPNNGTITDGLQKALRIPSVNRKTVENSAGDFIRKKL